MEFSSIHDIKLTIGQITGISDNMLHVYVGLAILLTVVVVLHKNIGSIIPWIFVFIIEIIGELMDMHYDFTYLGYWRWEDSLNDILHTILLPTMFLLIARFNVFWKPQYSSHKLRQHRVARRLKTQCSASHHI